MGHRTAPARTAPARTAPARTAPARTAQKRTAQKRTGRSRAGRGRLGNLTDLRRALVPGALVTVTNTRNPALSGRREVLEAHAGGWCLEFPDGHRYRGVRGPFGHRGSWLRVPRSSEVRFSGGTAALTAPGGVWLTLALGR